MHEWGYVQYSLHISTCESFIYVSFFHGMFLTCVTSTSSMTCSNCFNTRTFCFVIFTCWYASPNSYPHMLIYVNTFTYLYMIPPYVVHICRFTTTFKHIANSHLLSDHMSSCFFILFHVLFTQSCFHKTNHQVYITSVQVHT